MLGDDGDALELHGRGEQVVVGRPRVGDQPDLLWNLEADELGLAHRQALLAHLVRVRGRVGVRARVRVGVRVRVS